MGDLKFKFGVDAVGMEKREKVGITEVKGRGRRKGYNEA